MFLRCADCGSDPGDELLGDAVGVGEEETAEPEQIQNKFRPNSQKKRS